MSAPRPIHAPGGFTLIEVVIACAMAALIITGLYGAFSASLDAVSRVEESSGSLESTRLLSELIENDLLSLEPAAQNAPASAFFTAPKEADRQEDDDGDILVARMLTGAGGYFDDQDGPGRLYLVSYILRPYPGREDRYLLIRRELPHPFVARRDEENEAPTRDLTLAENVVSFSLSFEDGEQTDEPLESFDGEAREKAGKSPLPLAVRYALTLAREKNAETFQAVIALIPDSVVLR